MKNGLSSENINVFTAMENFSLYLFLEISYKIYGLFILKRKVKTFNFHDEMKQSFLNFECQSELTLLSAEKLIAKKYATQFFYHDFFLKCFL